MSDQTLKKQRGRTAISHTAMGCMLALRASFFLCLALFVIAAGAVFYVFESETEIEWLRAKIENSLNERTDGRFIVRVGSARFSVSEDDGAALRIEGLDIAHQNGRFFLASNAIKIVPKWFTLLSSQPEIKSVSLDGAAVRSIADDSVVAARALSEVTPEKTLTELASRDRAATLTLKNALLTLSPEVRVATEAFDVSSSQEEREDTDNPASKQSAVLQLVGAQLLKLSKAFDDVHRFGLDDIDIRNVAVQVLNEKRETLRNLRIISVNLNETKDASARRAQQHLTVKTLQSGAPGVEVKLSHVRDTATDRRAFVFDVKNILVANMRRKGGDPKELLDFDFPIDAKGSLVVKANGVVDRGQMAVTARPGTITTGPKSVFDITSGQVNLSLNTERQSIIIRPSIFRFGETKIVLEGGLKLPAGLLDAYAFKVKAKDSWFSASDANVPGVTVEDAVAEGALQPASRAISISRFEFETGEAKVNLSATFGFNGTAPSMALAATATPMHVDRLKQLWPIFIAPSARSWAMKNVYDGVVKSAFFDASVPHSTLGKLRKGAFIEDKDMVLSFNLEGARFRSFGDFPEIQQANVRGQTKGISFTAEVTSAEALSKEGGKVRVETGRFHIPDFRFTAPKTEISFTAKGKAQDVGEIANRNPVNALDKAQMSTQGLKGQVLASVDLRLPLKGDLKPNDVVWKALLDVDDFASPKPIDGRLISKADAKIAVSPDELSVSGRGLIDGIQADIDINQPLQATSDKRNLAVKVKLTEADRKKLGIDFGEYLKGPVTVEIDQNAKDKKQGAVYKVDLAKAELRLDFVGWRKRPGVAATATMRLIEEKNGTKVRDFVLKGNGFGARGEVDLTKKGEIKRLALQQLALKPRDKVAVTAKLRAERVFEIDVKGSGFDARSLIRVLTEDPNKAAEEAYRYKVKARIANVVGDQGERIRDLNLDVSLRGSTALKLAVSGFTKNARNPFRISYGRAGSQGDVLRGNGPDIGSLARFLNIYYRAYGGAFTIQGVRPNGSRSLSGRFVVDRFNLVDEPALSGLTAGRNGDGRKVVKFNVLDVAFSEANQVLTLRRGLLSGDNIGGTYEGVLNRRTKQVSVTGTYVPIYALNNFFTKIPLVGQVLGNGKREGLIGVTFAVEGKLGKPRVRINPLSALAPGFLRQLFKFRRARKQTN